MVCLLVFSGDVKVHVNTEKSHKKAPTAHSKGNGKGGPKCRPKVLFNLQIPSPAKML